MGYCMYQVDCDFRIDASRMGELFLALKRCEPNFYVSASDIEAASTVEELFNAWRWSPQFDEQNNMYAVYFEGEKARNEEAFLDCIAPFVDEGSFIEMKGEDDSMWRWWFTAEQCIEIRPKITWPDMDEQEEHK